jgi:hypothetical protein
MTKYAGFALAALLLVSCGGGEGGGGSAGGGGSTVFSGSWNCGTQQQCAIVMGASSGCREFTSLSACQVFFSGTTFGNSCGSGACTTTPGGTGALSSIAAILNGPNAAGQTSFWNIPALNNGALGGSSRLALFADGTGKLISVNNNCLIPIGQEAQYGAQAPVVTNFTWTATGTAALTFTNAAYHCLFDTRTDTGVSLVSSAGPLQSMSTISGGTSTATFTANIVQGSGGSRPITGTLASGTF